MTQYSDLSDIVLNACKDVTVATVAGISAVDWAANHVFSGIQGNIRGMNRGRLPYVYFYRNTSEYIHEVTSSTRGGTLTTSWSIVICAGTASRSGDDKSEETIWKIYEKIVKKLRSNWAFQQGSETTTDIVPFPFGYQMTLTITSINTYDDSTK